jgi:uncharacterized membrane protein
MSEELTRLRLIFSYDEVKINITMDTINVVLVILMAISLSAAAGLRAFIPPFAISLLAQAGYITLAPGFEWMGRWEVAAIFGLAAVLEIAADKFPGVDNFLDAAGLIVKPAAGALLASSIITGMDPMLAMVLGLIAGATTAGTIHVAKAKLRLLSTGFTGGLGNPVLSWVEDVLAVLGTALGYLAAPLAALVVIAMLAWIWRSILRLRRKRTEEPAITC